MSISDFFAAAMHGAALVYHEVVAIESDVTSWTVAHPEIGPLISIGTSFAATALEQSGIPVPAVMQAGTAVLAALKAMAAADPTVQSGKPVPVPVPVPVAAAVPASVLAAEKAAFAGVATQ